MKAKIIFLVATMLVGTFGSEASSQTPKPSVLKWPKTNKNLSLGVMYGNICASDELNIHAWGLNMQIYGFYFDCLIKTRNHSNDVAIDKWKETEAVSYHFGYQFPIIEYIRIIPVIGHSSVKKGITDGSNWTVTNNGISNAFDVKQKNAGFDYGGVLVLNYSCFCLYGAYTKHNQFYGGVGLEYRF